MNSISLGLKALSGAIGFHNLSREKRQVTFYSEGKNYWPHLESLLDATLQQTDLSVCYLSSATDDPGLALQHPRLNCFFIGDGFVRDYLFQTLQTNFMVMTMPDLHQYQVRRSKHKVHYIYVPHSLVSLHMVYRHGAFDHYDTICCAGPHHVQEIRAIEAKYNLPAKNIIELGYPRLESLIQEAQKRPPAQNTASPHKKILIAPSWGSEGLIESGLASRLIDELLELGHEVILRPHPQTTKLAPAQIKRIMHRHQQNPRFSCEDNVAGQESLHQSDLMISDWSGAALEYAFALNKPVIFCDTPAKINNPHYQDIDLVPLEVSIREEIGVVWDGKTSIASALQSCITKSKKQLGSLHLQNTFNSNNATEKIIEVLNGN